MKVNLIIPTKKETSLSLLKMKRIPQTKLPHKQITVCPQENFSTVLVKSLSAHLSKANSLLELAPFQKKTHFYLFFNTILKTWPKNTVEGNMSRKYSRKCSQLHLSCIWEVWEYILTRWSWFWNSIVLEEAGRSFRLAAGIECNWNWCVLWMITLFMALLLVSYWWKLRKIKIGDLILAANFSPGGIRV